MSVNPFGVPSGGGDPSWLERVDDEIIESLEGRVVELESALKQIALWYSDEPSIVEIAERLLGPDWIAR